MTELTDYVKLLFARQGVLHCRSAAGARCCPNRLNRSGTGCRKTGRAVITFSLSHGARIAKKTRRDLMGLGYDRLLA